MPARVRLLLLAAGLMMATADVRADPMTLIVDPNDPNAYSSIAAAVAVADGDLYLANYYDIRVATGTYVNDFANVLRPMTIEANGGPVTLLANGALLQNKGIIVTTSSLTVRGLTFQGAAISAADGGNGAGIRDQSASATTLRVENSTFLNNQDGILTGGSGGQETVEIVDSSFISNGSGTGQTHALYVGDALSLLVSNSLFCGTLVGHDIKSRAQSTTVAGSTVYDGATGPGCATAGSASYAIEAPNGGVVQILNDDIIQGALTQNTSMVGFGAEGLPYANNSLSITATNFVSSGVNAVGIQAFGAAPGTCQLSNTTFQGVNTEVSPADFCTVVTAPGPVAVSEPSALALLLTAAVGWGVALFAGASGRHAPA